MKSASLTQTIERLTPTEVQERSGREVQETAPEIEEKLATMTSSTTPTPPQAVPPSTPEARKSVPGKPRRRPPPPPAGGTAPSPQPVLAQANKLPPQTTQPSPKVREVSALSPAIHEESKPAAEEKVNKKPHPSRTAPEGDKSERSYTTSAMGGKKSASQPKGMLRPVKRQATASDLKPKYPARRPPPPPPRSLTSPPVKQPGKPSPGLAGKKVIPGSGSESVDGGGTPQQVKKKRVQLSRSTPVAPPRAKAKIQKVKRPISRNIPPPPNIPLPPPPVRTAPPTAGKAVLSKSDGQTKALSSASPQNATTHPIRAPRSKGPKPPPPTRVSSLTPEPKKRLRLTAQTPPTINEVKTTTENEVAVTKPTTPPPRRDRSVDGESLSKAPIPAKRQVPSSSGEGAKEETDSALVTDSPVNRKATRSAPPERPPPPRPSSAASNTSSRVQVNPDKPDKSATKPAKRERPPSLSPAGSPTAKGSSSEAQLGVVPLLGSSSKGKVLFDASSPQQSTPPVSNTGSEIKSKSGGFIKSLKKMVKRESGATDSSQENKMAPMDTKTPPNKRTSVKKDAPRDNGITADSKSPPVRPPTLSRAPHNTSLASEHRSHSVAKENGVKEEPKSPPTRPPPILSQQPKAETVLTATAEPKSPPISSPSGKVDGEQPKAKHETEKEAVGKREAVGVLKEEALGVQSEAKSEPVAPKPRPRKSEVTDEKVDKKPEATVEEKKEVKMVNDAPSRPPPPSISPSGKRKVSIPSRPPPPKTPTRKISTNSVGAEEQQSAPISPSVRSPTNSIPENSKPIPAPRKESQTKLLENSNGLVNSTSIAPVPIPRQKSLSPTPDEKSPTNPTGTNFYRALSDYQATRDGELSFIKGDVLIFIDRREKGLYFGMLDDGTTGLFPTSHVEPFFH